MTNHDSKNLADIAIELKQIRKVLERMVQAPIFDKPEPIKIDYDYERTGYYPWEKDCCSKDPENPQ